MLKLKEKQKHESEQKNKQEQEYKKCIDILKLGIEKDEITYDDVNNKSNKVESFTFEKYNKIKRATCKWLTPPV
jgi:hypothetical protein